MSIFPKGSAAGLGFYCTTCQQPARPTPKGRCRQHECPHGARCEPLVMNAAGDVLPYALVRDGMPWIGCEWCWSAQVVRQGKRVIHQPDWRELVKPPPYEYRADGWPLCPRCGEDELASQAALASALTRRATPADLMKCYRCAWIGVVPLR